MAACESQTLLSLNFRRQKYDPADFPVVFGEDGEVSRTKETGLTISSVPFTTLGVGALGHPKWLRYYKKTFAVPRCGELIYEGTISVKQVIPVDKVPSDFEGRIRNVRQDIRLASAGINMYDPATWMVADWFLSDQTIYAFYERLPLGKNQGTLGDYQAFSFAIPVASRAADPIKDFVRLGLGVSREKGTLSWYLNGHKVFEVSRIGLPLGDQYHLLEHGGQPGVVEIKNINIGFGTFSLMDMALPNNYSRELTVGDSIAESQLVQLDAPDAYRQLYKGFSGLDRPIDPSQTFAVTLDQYPDHNREVLLFGQGAILTVEKIRVVRYT